MTEPRRSPIETTPPYDRGGPHGALGRAVVWLRRSFLGERKVIEIPGCSAWGDTYEEALSQVKVAACGHLRVAEKYEDSIPGSDASGRRA